MDLSAFVVFFCYLCASINVYFKCIRVYAGENSPNRVFLIEKQNNKNYKF